MIEFCREKIVMANNPECKTYEEALHEESKNRYQCQVSFQYENGPADILPYDSAIQIVSCDIIKPALEKGVAKYQILGLPLTLERALVGLKYKLDEDYDFKEHTVTLCLKVGKILSIGYQFGTSRIFHVKIDWQPHKTLENQSDQTIEGVAELLGYKE